MIVTVGRVVRAHGIRGEVVVDVRTDVPEERFVAGASLLTEPASVGPVTVSAVRWHSGRLLVRFADVTDRNAAEALRGVRLLTEIGDDELPPEPDVYYDHQLVGMTVVTTDGVAVGTVREVIHVPAQDLLAVEREPGGEEVLVPFVADIVPEIDVARSRIVVDPPAGLLDLDHASGTETE